MSEEKKLVFEKLKGIQYPGTEISIVDSGYLKDIKVENERISIELQIPSPVHRIKNSLSDNIRSSLKENFNGKEISINFSQITKTKENDSNSIGKIKNIIAVASGKGGVGKSTITANLAVKLQQSGFKVGILDADIYGPSIPIMFDVQNEKPKAIEIEGKTYIEPINSYGVKLLSIGFFADVAQAVVWRGPMASKALNQMIHDANWGELDFLFVDMPPGTGDIHLSLLQAVPVTASVIVSTPQFISLADVERGIGLFKLDNINVPILGIIENMSFFLSDINSGEKQYIFGQSGAKNLADDLKISFLGELPLVQSIRESSDVGRPAALQNNEFIDSYLEKIISEFIEKLNERNVSLGKTEKLEITHHSGCK